MRKIAPLAAATAIGLVVSSLGGAMAATQGGRGQTSQGKVNVSAEVPQFVKISSLDDLTLGTFTGESDVTGDEDVCVWSNTGGYTLTASSSMGGSNFRMETNEGDATLDYNVAWAESAGAADFSQGTPLAAGSGQNFGSSTQFNGPNCGNGGANSSLLVQIPANEQNNPTAGNYSDTLTLMIEPN